jgi:hypothetical protein
LTFDVVRRFNAQLMIDVAPLAAPEFCDKRDIVWIAGIEEVGNEQYEPERKCHAPKGA